MGKWTKLVRQETKDRAKLARDFYKQGLSVEVIAKKIKRSASRVREYLKGAEGLNWNSKK